MIKTESSHSGKEETNYFYSTDEGRNWTDMRENFRIGTPIKEKYDFLGVFNPLTFEFVKFEIISEYNTDIYYMNLQGEIQKKVSYPYLSDFTGVHLNPIDPNFIALHRARQNQFPYPVFYNHDLGYSTDRGDTWDYLKPEEELKKQRDINLQSLRKIDFRFSSIEKGKMLMEFVWDNGSNFSYQLITGFNYIDKQYEFSDWSFNLEDLFCFECLGEDLLTIVNGENDELESFELFTKSKSIIKFKDKLPFLNIDSLENESRVMNIYEFWGKGSGFLKQNLLNNKHKVMYINIRSEYVPENSILINYINQLFFQTFDNGETWEFIFNSDDIENQVVDMFINYQNNDLWILKDTTETDRMISSSSKPILYKSKTSLTSIKMQDKSNFYVNYSNSIVNIQSENTYNNATIKIYNLNGKLLINKLINLYLGNNSININQEINEKLILIQISTKNKNNIFKLIWSD